MLGLRVLICLCLLSSTAVTYAQSTSPWKKIGEPTSGEKVAPSPGEGYMTVSVRGAAAYQNSNFWTNFVERNRQAVLTANLTATIANIPVTQTVTGSPVQLQKNRSMIDLGFAGTIVDHLPTTFSGMNVNLQINKTAQDGLQGLITQVSQLSTGTPPVLAISSQTMQITSFAKNVADFLFKANLLVIKAQTRNPFPTAGALDPGVYVCFAGDQETDYSQYLQNAQQLKWDGAQLTFSGRPVDNVSFFVIEITYQSTFFSKPLDALNFGASKPWVTLYLTAQNEIPEINSAADAAAKENDIQSHLYDARALLTQDYSFTNDERDAIDQAVHDKLNADLQKRLNDLGINTAAGNNPRANTPPVINNPPASNPAVASNAPVQPSQPGIRPVLDVIDPALVQNHAQIIQKLGTGTVMLPTTGP
jgi:hypothetical protein